MPPGTLFVVATPIGNLEDVTMRALRTLREVDLIAAEDTRRTSKLLARYEIRKPLVSLHEHNEHRESARLVEKLRAGQHIALVSDAGTPGISDPGAPLVRAAREAGMRVVPVPGPSAVAAALSVSGIELTEFAFMGFPPRSGGDRDEWMKRLRDEPRTVVFFEAPHRISRTLAESAMLLADRPIHVHKEITKLHETLVVYTNDLGDHDTNSGIGEYTIVVSPLSSSINRTDMSDCLSVFRRLTEIAGFDDDKAEQMTASLLGTTKAAVRKITRAAMENPASRLACLFTGWM
jgi:16S rRNA (cytidine1402-2'-O)-methyltransferase